jgi:type IX secretion system PorP/SprF family membrane protein
MERNLLLLLLWMVQITLVSAQQQITHTQYMFNGLTINPAYAGTDKYLNVTVQARQQWSGFKGSPTSQTLSLHTSMKNHKRIGLGMLLGREGMGVSTLYRVFLMYAYKVKVIRKNTLSLGLQAGITSYREELKDLIFPAGSSDPDFSQNTSYTLPNFGSGAYYYGKKFYIGIAVPFLAQNLINRKSLLYLNESRHYYLTGGCLFDISEAVKLKPNFLLRAVTGAPVNLDLNINLLIQKTVWIGCSYRMKNSVSALFEVQLTPRIRMGISYDIPISEIGKVDYLAGSPEVMLNYRAVKMLPNTVISPRFF